MDQTQTLCIILSAALIVWHVWNLKIGWRLYGACCTCCAIRTWFTTPTVKSEQPVPTPVLTPDQTPDQTPVPVLTTPPHLIDFDFDFDELYGIHTHVQAIRLDENTNTNKAAKSSELSKLGESMLIKIHKIALHYDPDHLRAAYIVEHDICTKSYTEPGLLTKIDDALKKADHKTIHAMWSHLKLFTIRYFIAMMVIVEEKSFTIISKPSTKRITIDRTFENMPSTLLKNIAGKMGMYIDRPIIDAARQVYIHGVQADTLTLMLKQKKSDVWYREWILGTMANLPQKYIDALLLQVQNVQQTPITGTGSRKTKTNATNATNAFAQTAQSQQAGRTKTFIEKDVYKMTSGSPSGQPLSIY